ncbi:hypothetical protein Tco_0454985 [Tanacetum coccineum]
MSDLHVSVGLAIWRFLLMGNGNGYEEGGGVGSGGDSSLGFRCMLMFWFCVCVFVCAIVICTDGRRAAEGPPVSRLWVGCSWSLGWGFGKGKGRLSVRRGLILLLRLKKCFDKWNVAMLLLGIETRIKDAQGDVEYVPEDQKDEMILSLMHQIKDLEKQVKERKEWAHQKAMQAARKLSHDLTELKMLRMEREETQRLKQGKSTVEDPTMKRLSEMETALRKASASKLSASESVNTCLEVARREKKYLKRLLAWEKQRVKLQDDIAAEKRRIVELQEEMVQVEAAKKTAEAKWKQEQKAKVLCYESKMNGDLKKREANNQKECYEALRVTHSDKQSSIFSNKVQPTYRKDAFMHSQSDDLDEKKGGQCECTNCLKDEVLLFSCLVLIKFFVLLATMSIWEWNQGEGNMSNLSCCY